MLAILLIMHFLVGSNCVNKDLPCLLLDSSHMIELYIFLVCRISQNVNFLKINGLRIVLQGGGRGEKIRQYKIDTNHMTISFVFYPWISLYMTLSHHFTGGYTPPVFPIETWPHITKSVSPSPYRHLPPCAKVS